MIRGVHGYPYICLDSLLDLSGLSEEIDIEVKKGLYESPYVTFTGGNHKYWKLLPPNQGHYVDYMEEIFAMDESTFENFKKLNSQWSQLKREDLSHIEVGETTSYSLNRDQMSEMALNYDVNIPWKRFFIVIPSHFRDRMSSQGKRIVEEAKIRFPLLLKLMETLPFEEIGRVSIFGVEPGDYVNLHRDLEKYDGPPGEFITLSPQGQKSLFIQDLENSEKHKVQGESYWFNDMDFHGTEPIDQFTWSVRVDGQFTSKFRKQIQAILDNSAKQDQFLDP